MYPLLPLVPFWALNTVGVTPSLPGWYLKSYSEEDRLKQIAERQGVSEAWDLLALDRINALTAAVNGLIEENTDLKARVAALEAK